jgi:hypothetical protein
MWTQPVEVKSANPPKYRRFHYKKEALTWKEEVEKLYGGIWSLDGVSGNYEVSQVLSKEAKEKEARIAEAKLYLSDDFDYFKSQYLGIYRQKERLEKEINEWLTRASKDPFYAFRWADTAVEFAAELNLIKSIVAAHERGVEFIHIVEEVEREADRRATSQRQSSTSAMSNFTEECERIQYVKYAKQLRSYYTKRQQAIGYLYCVEEGLA